MSLLIGEAVIRFPLTFLGPGEFLHFIYIYIYIHTLAHMYTDPRKPKISFVT